MSLSVDNDTAPGDGIGGAVARDATMAMARDGDSLTVEHVRRAKDFLDGDSEPVTRAMIASGISQLTADFILKMDLAELTELLTNVYRAMRLQSLRGN